MKLTQEQAEKLKTLKTEEEVRAFFETEKIELAPEDLDKIAGGWGILDSVINTFKDTGKWMYDNLIDPAVDGTEDAAKKLVDACAGALGIDVSSDSLTAPAKKK